MTRADDTRELREHHRHNAYGMPVTREVHIIQPIPQLPVSRRGMKRWWLSAVVYLTLCVWLGPPAAFWLTVIGAWTLCWFYLCGRFPVSAGCSALAAAVTMAKPHAAPRVTLREAA